MLCKLIEQYTKEQLDTEATGGETSNLDTKNPESSAEATKDSVALSLLDDVREMVVHDSFPEEVHLDDTIEVDVEIEGKDDSKQSVSITDIPG